VRDQPDDHRHDRDKDERGHEAQTQWDDDPDRRLLDSLLNPTVTAGAEACGHPTEVIGNTRTAGRRATRRSSHRLERRIGEPGLPSLGGRRTTAQRGRGRPTRFAGDLIPSDAGRVERSRHWETRRETTSYQLDDSGNGILIGQLR
jgi:hypothetical protein